MESMTYATADGGCATLDRGCSRVNGVEHQTHSSRFSGTGTKKAAKESTSHR